MSKQPIEPVELWNIYLKYPAFPGVLVACQHYPEHKILTFGRPIDVVKHFTSRKLLYYGKDNKLYETSKYDPYCLAGTWIKFR